MAKGPLRQAITDFVKEEIDPQKPDGYWARFRARDKEYFDLFFVWKGLFPAAPFQVVWSYMLVGVLYDFTGYSTFVRQMKEASEGKPAADLSDSVTKQLNTLFKSPVISEVIDTFGAAITVPVLTLFEEFAGMEDPDPLAFAKRFHGIMIGIGITGGVASTVIEAASLGQIKGAGKMLDQLYWSLGLGFLGWQTMAPLLSAGLQPPLTRHYNEAYRPLRFTAGDLRDLFALGEISKSEMKTEAGFLGWREKDIDSWIKLAFKTLPQGDVWAALKAGLIGEPEAVRRLRALGYDPADIPLLFMINQSENQETERSLTASTIRQAYRGRIISETDLRTMLKGINYSDLEIDLIVSIENAKTVTDEKTLAVGQIKDAWIMNVLTTPEAEHWLTLSGLGADAIPLILRTWQAEIIPTYRKLNLSTITGAYVEGILSRSQARDKLVSIGLVGEDADLELDLAEKRNPQAFNPGLVTTVRKLAPSALADLLALGLIGAPTMIARLLELGYVQADADLLTQAAVIRAQSQGRPLTQNTINRAYLAGVLDRNQAEAELGKINFTPEQIKLVLDTLELENPEVFDLPPAERIMTLGPGMLDDLRFRDLISEADYTRRLAELGFNAEDISLLLERSRVLIIGEPRPLNQFTVERAYLVGVLTRDQAISKLLTLDFTETDAINILATVELENPALFNPDLAYSVRLPSITALAAAVQNEIITENEYFVRAAEIGYMPEDARIYLALATKQERKSTKSLTASQLLNAYGAGLMPRGETLSRMYQQGYNDPDAVLLLRMEKDFIEYTDTWNDLLSGALDPFDAVSALINAHYADADIVDAFAKLPPAILSAMGIDLSTLKSALGEIPGGA